MKNDIERLEKIGINNAKIQLIYFYGNKRNYHEVKALQAENRQLRSELVQKKTFVAKVKNWILLDLGV